MNLLYANDTAGAYPPSYYAATATPIAPFAPLRGEVRADVCVIGAGFTGLSAALHLAQAGRRVVVVEAHRVGFGASGRNGGQVGSGQRQDQVWLEKTVGREAAHQMWQVAEESKALVRSLITDLAMPLRFNPGIAHACWTEAQVRDTHAYAEKLHRDYGYDQLEPLDRAGIRALIGSPVYQGGEVDWGAGYIHPLNFAIGLAKAAAAAGAVIHEETPVHHIDETGPKPVVQTDRGRVMADQVILACNGYLGGLNRKVAAKVMPINNFIVATEPLGDRAKGVLSKPVAVADTKFVVNYWHLSDDGRLLFGGGESYGWKFPDLVKTVSKPMLEVYPQLRDVRIDHAWGGTLAITMNRMPCFTRPGKALWSASGYSGHGVALATLAGKMMAQAVQGHTDQFDLMASLPQPRFPGGTALRWPMLVAAMTWFSLRDRLGM
jgi:gamma-glutamylputrescine oxidase